MRPNCAKHFHRLTIRRPPCILSQSVQWNLFRRSSTAPRQDSEVDFESEKDGLDILVFAK